jgi:hypothetical protein
MNIILFQAILHWKYGKIRIHIVYRPLFALPYENIIFGGKSKEQICRLLDISTGARTYVC